LYYSNIVNVRQYSGPTDMEKHTISVHADDPFVARLQVIKQTIDLLNEQLIKNPDATVDAELYIRDCIFLLALMKHLHEEGNI
jgi:hypothetical protein